MIYINLNKTQKKDNIFLKIWRILYPPAIYMAVQNIVSIIYIFIVNVWIMVKNLNMDPDQMTEELNALYNRDSMMLLVIAASLCIPVYYLLYKKDKIRNHEKKRRISFKAKDIIVVILSSAALGFCLNCLISMTPLPEIFNGYEEVNESIYSANIIWQILAACIFACIVEELIMRGVVYKRIRYYSSVPVATILSALYFGIYHMNVIQGIYAFFLGLYFAYIYERYDSIIPCIAAHMAANTLSTILSNNGLEFIFSGPEIYCLAIGLSVIIFYFGSQWIDKTKPAKIEFVMAPEDTLEELRREYAESIAKKGITRIQEEGKEISLEDRFDKK